MHLEPGWYIDAREVANMARFINHSCDPNCKLVPVNVAGHMRVSIVCIREVPPGGFLSYDYQFNTQHGEKFICRCGAENCWGTMVSTALPMFWDALCALLSPHLVRSRLAAREKDGGQDDG